LRILLIDDEGEYRHSMRALLEKVFEAKIDDVDSGAAGIAKIRAGDQYDIIFLDLMMPGMNGNETRAGLLKENPDLFIAFMSAYSDSQEWQLATNSGAPLLHKPLRREDLIKVLTQGGDIRQ
jgi:CheY-like chemotaxis protein